MESTRKRLKNIEDIEGTTKCVTVLQQLQASTPNLQPWTRLQELYPENEDDVLEPEEEIFQRQLALTVQARSKNTAKIVLQQ